jgi:hypothetical protein
MVLGIQLGSCSSFATRVERIVRLHYILTIILNLPQTVHDEVYIFISLSLPWWPNLPGCFAR